MLLQLHCTQCSCSSISPNTTAIPLHLMQPAGFTSASSTAHLSRLRLSYKLVLTTDLFLKGLVTDHRTTCALEEVTLGSLFKQWKFLMVHDGSTLVLKRSSSGLNVPPSPSSQEEIRTWY